MLRTNGSHDFFDVPIHFDAAPLLFDIAFLVDQESRTDDAVIFFPVIFLQLPDAIELGHFMVLVDEQIKWEVILGDKVLMFLLTVGRYPKDDRAFHLRQRIAEIACLGRTTRCRISRIEV